MKLGGDILIATTDGIVPLTATMSKDVSALSLAAITYNIEPMWTREYVTKRTHPVDARQVGRRQRAVRQLPRRQPATENSLPHQTVGVSNLHTGAWAATPAGTPCASCN